MQRLPGRAGFTEVAGTRAFVQEWGEGEPLVCIHGLGGGGHFFAALGAALGSRIHVVAPDLPGCGHSAAPSFSFEQCAGFVISLADERRWPRVSLLGHSMGTIIALEAARRRPSLAAALVLVGGLPEPLPAARARLAARAERVERDGLAGLSGEVIDANFARRTRREHPELTASFGRAFELQSPVQYVSATRALAEWTMPSLPTLDGVPCLVVTGEEDLYAPPKAVTEFAARLPAETRVEILKDCAHLPFLEQPSSFAALIAEFLEDARTRHSVEGRSRGPAGHG